MTRDPRNAQTEALERKPREESGDPIAFRNGKIRASIPVAWVASGLISAAGVAWGVAERVMANKEAENQAQIHAILKRASELETRASRLEQSLAVEQALMASINTKLSELNARVAEVQVTLMRDRHP